MLQNLSINQNIMFINHENHYIKIKTGKLIQLPLTFTTIN